RTAVELNGLRYRGLLPLVNGRAGSGIPAPSDAIIGPAGPQLQVDPLSSKQSLEPCDLAHRRIASLRTTEKIVTSLLACGLCAILKGVGAWTTSTPQCVVGWFPCRSQPCLSRKEPDESSQATDI